MSATGMAVKLMKRLEAASAAQQSALAANAADAERLQKLDTEIAAMEQRVDAEDLPALNELAARRDQRERLATKFKADAQKRQREADAASAISDEDISDVFWEVMADVKAHVILSVRPFVSDLGKAERFAESCDSVLVLQRHANTWGSLPPAQRFTGLLNVLQEFLNGRPPWIFNTSTERTL